MGTMKDHLKVAITALISVLMTMTVTGTFTKVNKINNAATKQELIVVGEESKSYTDKKIIEHAATEKVMVEAIKEQQEKTYQMVKFLYERELNKK